MIAESKRGKDPRGFRALAKGLAMCRVVKLVALVALVACWGPQNNLFYYRFYPPFLSFSFFFFFFFCFFFCPGAYHTFIYSNKGRQS